MDERNGRGNGRKEWAGEWTKGMGGGMDERNGRKEWTKGMDERNGRNVLEILGVDGQEGLLKVVRSASCCSMEP
ncbi:MAG: hypothetical protein IJ887_07860 [Prevotella sp.]|nr:hypothetical protein [Prevotella sp.]MBR3480675.1 hypothetical protein [Prevotella sp.]